MSQFNGMSQMFAVNQLMGHLNNKIRSNATYFAISDDPHINDTIHMVIQMILIGIFTGMATYITNSFNAIPALIKNIIFNGPTRAINMIASYFKKVERKHKIVRHVPLITTSLQKNADLHTKLQWFLSSEFCEKVSPKELITVTPVKEIYYVPMGVDINTTDKELKLNESPLVGNDMVVRFENHDISVRLVKETIEVNGDLDSTKRDNMIYQLTVYCDDEASDILQRFCNYAILKHNTTKQKWEQKIYNHNGGQWDNGVKCYSPNIDSVVLRSNMKDDVLNIMDFFHHNELYYINNGMRYKNILLNLGYPGTGKTTFSCALAARYRKHIYSINLNNLTSPDDLKKLMDSFAQKVTNGIIMIDDIDHTFEQQSVETDTVIMDKPSEKVKPKYRVSVPELLGFFDGLNTIHGLVVIMCANDPLKFFDKNDHSFSALCRDQRINHIFEFETCDRNMIATIYKNIFGKEIDMMKLAKIENDYYAPCTIAKVFSSFYEKNGGKIENKQDDIDMLLVDLANKTVRTNDEIIVEYSKRYQRDHPNN
jgi:hypothetical protein